MTKDTTNTIIVADALYIVRKGFRNLIDEIPDIRQVDEVSDSASLAKSISKYQPDVLILDFDHPNFTIADISRVKQLHAGTNIIAITQRKDKHQILTALTSGINCYILKECSEDEILDAINAALINEKFFCGKILDLILEDKVNPDPILKDKTDNCEPVQISDRELEIITLIADGFTYKEIAEKLCLSSHTVTTHRKNIMKKLEIKNTAGIVRYAFQADLVHLQ